MWLIFLECHVEATVCFAYHVVSLYDISIILKYPKILNVWNFSESHFRAKKGKI